MYAIVEIAGQQFKIEKDQQIFVHRLDAKEGSKVDFDKVLLMNDAGKNVTDAGPSIPVQLLGLNGVPSPGDVLNVVKNEREAKKIVENRIAERKKLENIEVPKVASLEDFFSDVNVGEGEKKVLNLVIRADVQGSYEAIKDSIMALGNDEVGLEIVSGGVGAITDNDVNMAGNTGGYLIGFNMRPVTSARKLAEQKGIEVIEKEVRIE